MAVFHHFGENVWFSDGACVIISCSGEDPTKRHYLQQLLFTSCADQAQGKPSAQVQVSRSPRSAPNTGDPPPSTMFCKVSDAAGVSDKSRPWCQASHTRKAQTRTERSQPNQGDGMLSKAVKAPSPLRAPLGWGQAQKTRLRDFCKTL